MAKMTAISLFLALFVTRAAAITYYYMDQNCNSTVDMTYLDSIRLQLTASSTYKSNMHCYLRVTTSEYSDSFMLYFKDFEVESSSGCTYDWLEVRDGMYLYSPYVAGLYGRQCGYYMSSSVRQTTGSDLYLLFKSDSSVESSGFDMVITQYHTGVCDAFEYSCSNGRCISDSLSCNGYNPCGDYSDCGINGVITGSVIAGIIVSSFGFVIILTTILLICRHRRRLNTAGVHRPVYVGATNYGTGYNQPIPQQYPTAVPPTYQQYPTAAPPSYQAGQKNPYDSPRV